MKVYIPVKDGSNIEADLFLVQADADVRDVLIINKSVGVDQQFYHPFAQAMSEFGFCVLTYNYNDGSDFLRRKFDRLDDEVFHWGKVDFDAVVQWSRAEYPDAKLHVLGHGVGGAITLFAPSLALVDTLITVNTQIINWYELPKSLLLKSIQAQSVNNGHYTMFARPRNIPVTALSTAADRKLKQISHRFVAFDLNPSAVCVNPIFDKEFKGRKFTISIKDDVLLSPAAVNRFSSLFTKANTYQRTILPIDIHEDFIGFFGFFIPHEYSAMWTMVASWIHMPDKLAPETYAIFDDSTYPLVRITVSNRDPDDAMVDEYIANMERMLRRGPTLYLLIDLSHVNWADSRLRTKAIPWIKKNQDLIKKSHKLTVYIAPNALIRTVLSVFHLFDLESLIKPYVVFKTKEQAEKYLEVQMEKDGVV